MITRFMDMCSGGIKVKPYHYILIEMPYDDTVRYFEKRFDRDPHNVTCDCCGEDYSVDEYDTIEAATEYDRRDYTTKGLQTVADYCARKDVLVIRADKSENK